MARSGIVGRVPKTVSLIHQSLLQGSCTFVVFFFSFRVQTLANVVHATRSENTTPRRTHRRAWHRRIFVSCTRDQRTCAGSRPNSQGHVDYLSPRAHQKSLIRLMFRGTSLESQFSSPNPFSSFCSAPPPAQTSLLNTGMSKNPCVTPQGRSPLWPNGRAEPSHSGRRNVALQRSCWKK